MEKLIRTALLITISILYATTVFLVSRSIFPLPESCAPGPIEVSQQCWQNYEAARRSAETSQKLLSLAISAVTVLMTGLARVEKEIKASILLGAGITAIISSGISEMPAAGAALSGVVLVGILIAVRKP